MCWHAIRGLRQWSCHRVKYCSKREINYGVFHYYYFTNAELLKIGTLRDKLKLILSQKSYFFIQENAFENAVWEIVSISSRGRWVDDKARYNLAHSDTENIHCILCHCTKPYPLVNPQNGRHCQGRLRLWLIDRQEIHPQAEVILIRTGWANSVINKWHVKIYCIKLEAA